MNVRSMAFGFFYLFIVVVWMGFICAIGYAALHFIVKFW